MEDVEAFVQEETIDVDAIIAADVTGAADATAFTERTAVAERIIVAEPVTDVAPAAESFGTVQPGGRTGKALKMAIRPDFEMDAIRGAAMESCLSAHLLKPAAGAVQ